MHAWCIKGIWENQYKRFDIWTIGMTHLQSINEWNWGNSAKITDWKHFCSDWLSNKYYEEEKENLNGLLPH